VRARHDLETVHANLLESLSRRRGSLAWFWFLLPAATLALVFFFLPVIITLVISLTNMTTATGLSGWSWIGTGNYRKILANPDTLKYLWATARYVAFTLLFNVLMGLLISLITTHLSETAGLFYRAIWLLPRITPPVVYVLMWKMIAAKPPYGILNQLIVEPLGLAAKGWIPEAAFLFVVLVNGMVGASFGMIIFTSAIESIPKDIMISSLVDGASTLQRVRYIILPQLRWPLLFVTTYQTLSLLTSYEYILILTDGNFNTEVWALWAFHRALSNYWGNFQYGLGAALAAILVVIGVGMGAVYLRYFKFNELVQEPKIAQV